MPTRCVGLCGVPTRRAALPDAWRVAGEIMHMGGPASWRDRCDVNTSRDTCDMVVACARARIQEKNDYHRVWQRGAWIQEVVCCPWMEHRAKTKAQRMKLKYAKYAKWCDKLTPDASHRGPTTVGSRSSTRSRSTSASCTRASGFSRAP
eukprot:5461607-Prymnesium_polylepis.1